MSFNPKNLKGRDVVLVLVVLIVILNLPKFLGDDKSNPEHPSKESAKVHELAAGATSRPRTHTWDYDNFADPMTGKKGLRYATLESDNVLDLKEGVGKATLTVTANLIGDGEPDGHLDLSLGMFDDGRSRIRFDDGKVMYLDELADWLIGTGEGGTRYRSYYHIFKSRYAHKPDFFTLLKTSKHLRIEVPIVENGTQILEFSIAGLDPTIFTNDKKGKLTGSK